MVGVIVWALGLEEMFASLDHGESVEVSVVVLGYVVMRLSMVFLWSLAARQDPGRSPAARKYIWTISLTQAGWHSVPASGCTSSRAS